MRTHVVKPAQARPLSLELSGAALSRRADEAQAPLQIPASRSRLKTHHSLPKDDQAHQDSHIPYIYTLYVSGEFLLGGARFV